MAVAGSLEKKREQRRLKLKWGRTDPMGNALPMATAHLTQTPYTGVGASSTIAIPVIEKETIVYKDSPEAVEAMAKLAELEKKTAKKEEKLSKEAKLEEFPGISNKPPAKATS